MDVFKHDKKMNNDESNEKDRRENDEDITT
jgi:hypothetical protein